MQEVITDKDILELQGKEVVITQGAYRGELGVIADIEECEGSIFYIVILQNGKERYFTKDFIEIVEDETENNKEEENEIEEERKAIEVEGNEEATEEAGDKNIGRKSKWQLDGSFYRNGWVKNNKNSWRDVKWRRKERRMCS